jgi:hypothetical protein
MARSNVTVRKQGAVIKSSHLVTVRMIISCLPHFRRHHGIKELLLLAPLSVTMTGKPPPVLVLAPRAKQTCNNHPPYND